MAVKTAKVAGRRTLRFASFGEMLDDAERLASADRVRMLGNWSLGQIFAHLARSFHNSIDGVPHRAPFYMRWAARALKNRLLARPMSPGFRLPNKAEADYAPQQAGAAEGLQLLREAVARFERQGKRSPHVVLGALSEAEWRQLHLRHAELHLSFAVPEESRGCAGLAS